jgi:hypothetical protein
MTHIKIVILLAVYETTGFSFILLGIATQRTPEVIKVILFLGEPWQLR